MKHPRRAAYVFLAGLVSCLIPARGEALDLTAFASQSSPDTKWSTGYGGAIGARFFGILTAEGEAAWYGGVGDDLTMTTFTAAALVSPPFGPVTPYGGLCVGTFRQTTRFQSDYGTLKGLVLGVRANVLTSLVVKGEYRAYELSGTPLAPFDHRFSVGAGLSF